MNNSNTIIVVSTYSELGKNLDWIQKFIKKGYHVCLYDHKKSNLNPYYVPENKGREASVYLRYIIDYYDSLQEYTIFIQDDDKSWHHKGSIVDIIIEKEKENNSKTKKIKYKNLNNRCLSLIYPNDLFPMMKIYFRKYLSPYIGDMSKYGDWTSGYPCCSQFIVHKEYIRKYPKEMYEKMYRYMMDGRHDEKAKGHMFEWTLHLLYDNPFTIHNMSEKEFFEIMEKRKEKIEKNQFVYFDDCRVI